MPFGAPFYYCGKTVRSFSDVAAAPSPMLEAAGTSFAPVLLSLESWTPHAYLGTLLQLTVHVVNDDDSGAHGPLRTDHVDEILGRGPPVRSERPDCSGPVRGREPAACEPAA